MPDYVTSYVHGDGRIGVLLQLRCNDSFSLRTEELKSLAHDLALHIAALQPISVSPADLPPEWWEAEIALFGEKLAGLDTPERQRRLKELRERFECDRCLLKQRYIKDDKISVEGLVKSVEAKLRDRITIVKFTRYEASET